jgi:hypothetical protein
MSQEGASMKSSNRNICFHSPANPPVSFVTKSEGHYASQIAERQKLSFSSNGAGTPESVSFSTARCSEKGCVFPASSQGSGKCSYHLRQQEEPVLFRSHQPTGMLLDPARMSPSDREYDGSRKRDRRRMADLWEQFQTE